MRSGTGESSTRSSWRHRRSGAGCRSVTIGASNCGVVDEAVSAARAASSANSLARGRRCAKMLGHGEVLASRVQSHLAVLTGAANRPPPVRSPTRCCRRRRASARCVQPVNWNLTRAVAVLHDECLTGCDAISIRHWNRSRVEEEHDRRTRSRCRPRERPGSREVGHEDSMATDPTAGTCGAALPDARHLPSLHQSPRLSGSSDHCPCRAQCHQGSITRSARRRCQGESPYPCTSTSRRTATDRPAPCTGSTVEGS